MCAYLRYFSLRPVRLQLLSAVGPQFVSLSASACQSVWAEYGRFVPARWHFNKGRRVHMKQAVYAQVVGAVKDADAHLLPLQRRCCIAVKAQPF